MDKQFKIYISESLDPKVNLSVEEWLMENSGPDELVMYLWQNENTIVIGRNQNPYKECDIKKIKEDKVQLIRRLSGGGAVYHDLGNLNFTFIASDEHYDIKKNMEIILKGISKFGIKGIYTGRNDLVVENRKFSGNAFMSDKGMHCHHGTLLVDVNLEKLSRYLTVSSLKLKSKGIDSVVSRVVNLKEIVPQITVEKLRKALIDSFNETYDVQAQMTVFNQDSIDLTSLIKKYDSWQWNYSESPDFSITMEEKFEWGIFEIHLNISDGIISDCKCFTDSIIMEDFHGLGQELKYKPLERNGISDMIMHHIKSRQIRNDLCCLINNKL